MLVVVAAVQTGHLAPVVLVAGAMGVLMQVELEMLVRRTLAAVAVGAQQILAAQAAQAS
jgi:hypothetical protein